MTDRVPVEVYREKYWEIYDPQDARVVAHVFSKRHAELFAAILNNPL